MNNLAHPAAPANDSVSDVVPVPGVGDSLPPEASRWFPCLDLGWANHAYQPLGGALESGVAGEERAA